MSGLMSKFPANRNVIGLVVVIQQSWHTFCRNACVQIVLQNALNSPIWQSYYLTNIVDSSLRSARTASRTLAVFWCACRWSFKTPIVVDRRLSVLEVFYHKKFCFGSWHISEGFLQQLF
jgi:hypothetical protein